MSELFGGILKPGDGGRAAIKRELEARRNRWEKPGYLYRGGGDYMLKHGRYYQGRVLPDQYDHIVGAPSSCFANAHAATQQDPSLRYVEGVYDTGGCYFTPHAWCIDANDEVVELTYPTKNLLPGTHNQNNMPILAPEHWAYWGVIFQPELVWWFFENYGEACMFDRPHEDSMHMVRTGLDMTQSHDCPILKVPYDPARTSL